MDVFVTVFSITLLLLAGITLSSLLFLFLSGLIDNFLISVRKTREKKTKNPNDN